MTKQQKVAIVTGGGTGIGSATCKRLANDGFAVIVAYSRSADGAEEIAKEIIASNGTALVTKADIKLEEDVSQLFQFTLDRFGRIDVVINNAGIGHMKSFADITMDEYDHLFDTNARGTFMMCREAAKHIQDGGRIINISTGATTSNSEGMVLYVSSKLAIEGYTKILAKELGPRQIAVNTVSPGMVDTPMLEGGDAEALRQWGAQAAAMKRCGEAEDIADAIGSLVSSDGRWITGQNISVSGGSTII